MGRESWWRKYAGIAVTVVVVLIGGAIAWGTAINQVHTVEDDVGELETDVTGLRGDIRQAYEERADLRSGAAVRDTQITHLAEALARVTAASQTLGQAVARLEVILAQLPQAQP